MTPFEPASGLPAALALRIGIIAVTLLAVRRTNAARQLAFLGSAIASIVSGLTAVAVLRGGSPVHGVLLVHEASQFALTYAVDGLAAWFLAVLSLLAVPIAVFTEGRHEAGRRTRPKPWASAGSGAGRASRSGPRSSVGARRPP